MPHLVQMDKRYGKKGLQIIGAETQASSLESITKITKKLKIKFPIIQGVSGPSTGNRLPRAVVFDAAGQIVYFGHPGEDKFERSIKKALQELKKTGGVERKSNLPEAGKPLIAKRNWTNIDGKEISATLLSVDGDYVRFKLPNGKKAKYPINQLIESDQTLIKETASTKKDQ